MIIKINNREIRKLWLDTNGLLAPPSGPLDLINQIKKLGFVQLDTIQNVSRAHHHILWSRNQNYREPMLENLLSTERQIFEHFTHDASVIPVDFYPMWKRQFSRMEERRKRSSYYKPAGNKQEIIDHITTEGPLSTHAFDTKINGKKEMWERPPHKNTLDYLWYVGILTTSHRINFAKYYDLAERLIPEALLTKNIPDNDQIDWLCNAALERLSFASIKEIKQFWDAMEIKEAREWTKSQSLKMVEYQSDDGKWHDAYAVNNIEEKLRNLKSPTNRIRLINPFDPAIRDRDRLKRLFGFDYKIEIFVPEHKRQYGYYVYPLLEKDRFIGRIELKADRKKNYLNVTKFWKEEKIKWSNNKFTKLDAELARFARLAGIQTVNWLANKS